jgi:hypothetical protein
MSNGNEEIVEFVTELLKKPPGPPNSVQFEIDTDGDVQALFEVLLITMTEILKTWYPPPITIALIADEDVARIKAYFASFSLKFHFNVEDVPRVLHINNKEYLQKSRLEDMRFRVSAGEKLYTVYFSSLATR